MKLTKIWLTLGWAAFAYILISALLYLFQERFIFHPAPLDKGLVYPFSHRFSEHFVPLASGDSLNLLWFRSNTSHGLVLYYHGNADNLLRWGNIADDILPLGYDLMVYDYRGFGKSSGENTEADLLADALSVYHFARKYFAADSIVLFGRSLGTGLATYVASQQEAKQLILETPYYSLDDVAGRYLPMLPYRQLLRYHIPSYQWLPKVTYPVLILHGTDDQVVSYASGRALSRHLKDGDRFVTIPEGKHHDLNTFPVYRDALRTFLTSP
jgi:alpha-beta hydrolase superfamily lysophospholipase